MSRPDQSDLPPAPALAGENAGPGEVGRSPTTPATEARSKDSERVFWGPRDNRFRVESLLVRLVSTLGIVGIGVLLGAILVSQDVAGWIVGLVISATSVILAAILWSSRRL